jgi:hypothetical protein
LYPSVLFAVERDKFAKIGPVGSVAVALRGGKLVSKAMLDRMWRAYPEKNSPDYGYGLAILETLVGRALRHDGSLPGISLTPRCTPTWVTQSLFCRTTGVGQRW